jgi:hypothetical protein
MQRLIGVVLGGVVTFVLLLLLIGPDGTRIVGDETQAYLVAVLVGAIVSWAWPVVIAWYLIRRRRGKQQERIEAEVQRQIADDRSRGG